MKYIYELIAVFISMNALGKTSYIKERIVVKNDVENIKLLETKYVNDSVEYTHYFTRDGDVISTYDWQIGITEINKIRNRLLNEFNINDSTYAQGKAVLFLILNAKRDKIEIRLYRGITTGFDKELLRAIAKIEKESIFVIAPNSKVPIVVPFAIQIDNYW